MSLYDGLLDLGPTKKEEEDKAKAKAKELPAHLKRKLAAGAAPPPPPPPPPPPSASANHVSSVANSVVSSAKKTVEAVAVPVASAPLTAVVEDPYDPARPNSYEKLRGLSNNNNKKQKTKPPSIGKDLLLKAGWKDGQRLGKRGDGLMRPLDPIRLANGQEKYESLVGSRVLVIKNAAGAGDVDEDLAPDLQAECCKCGTVTEIVIWECSCEADMAKLPPFEHVRVFVAFDSVEAASKALEAMNGRFFGGRQLQVSFFNEELFRAKKLAP